MKGKAPYRQVLTHGFTVDGQGRKMSKSIGNTVSPQDVMNKLGADILRLWVASTDYTGEMAVSDEILKRAAIVVSVTPRASCWRTSTVSIRQKIW